MLRDAEIASMRITVATWLPDACQILTNMATRGAGGGLLDNWQASTPVPCRLMEQKSKDEQTTAEQVKSVTTYQVQFAWNVTVSANQRLLIGGVTYEVTIPTDTESDDLDSVCEVRRLQ